MMTVQQALKQGITLLNGDRLDAQVLLGFVLGVDRTALYAYPETELTAEQERQFFTRIERRGRGGQRAAPSSLIACSQRSPAPR